MERKASTDVFHSAANDLEKQPAAGVAESLLQDRHGPVGDGCSSPSRERVSSV
jgi:hypothetical protein